MLRRRKANGPRRTGSVDPFKRSDGSVYYRGRIRLGDGSLHRLTIPEPFCNDAADARKYTGTTQVEEDTYGRILARKRGTPLPASTETVREWHARWVASRVAKGNTSTRDDRSRYETHADHLIGDKPMAVVTRADVEGIVESLDAKVRAGKLSWHTAWNAWAVVSRMFRDAAVAKQRDLRVREDNPCANVAPPDRGVRLAKQFLYPSELLALFACGDVALEWRRLIALAVYLYPRAGELEALEWQDVDLERGIVHIHRGIDRERGGTKGTKTGIARRFSIERAALPLLRAMHQESDGAGRVVRQMPRMRDLAEGLRNFLTLADVTRYELHHTDQTRKALTWHDLRATGITWMAIRGDDPLHIQHRAGHSSFSTTQGYIRQAEAVREGFGDVFPPLDHLAGTTERSNRSKIGSKIDPRQSWRRGIYARKSAERAGFEPAAGF
ncbi:MAG TPA: tyrosine-type recombinase/integrase [Polyangiaceae bacterium]|nr:tyrosine-type recombinase/integrase [Polyangiaceae bacterium]